MKRCSVCGQTKPLDDFYRSARSKDGRKPDCATCRKEQVKRYAGANRDKVREKARSRPRKRNRERENERQRQRAATPEGQQAAREARLRSTHGMTLVMYNELLSRQGGTCGICRKPPDGTPGTNSAWLHVDHDHLTGAIRGLLCRACNTAIGLFRDDRERLQAAALYIRNARAADA